MKNLNSKGFGFVGILAVIVLLGLIAAVGWLVYDRQNQQSSPSTEIESSQSGDPEDAVESTSSEVETTTKPAVAFVPEGLFTEAEKAELKKKLISPVTDYSPERVVAIKIEVNSPDKFILGNNNYKYLVDFIGHDGVYEGFLYGTKGAEEVDWWVPVCFEGCEFSEEFKNKYPEIVEKSNN